MPFAKIERYVENVAVGAPCKEDGTLLKGRKTIGLSPDYDSELWPKLNQVVMYRLDSKPEKIGQWHRTAFGTVLAILK